MPKPTFEEIISGKPTFEELAGDVLGMPTGEDPYYDISGVSQEFLERRPSRKIGSDIATVGRAVKELQWPTTEYAAKESRQATSELYDRLKWWMTYSVSLGGRVGPKGLREELLNEAEDFAGFGPALTKAAGESGAAAITWGFIYPKLFKLAGLAGQQISRIPQVSKAIAALKSTGALQKFAKSHPHIYSAINKSLAAFGKGEAVGQTIAAIELLGKDKPYEEWLVDMNKRGAIIGGVSMAFSLAHSYDQYKYISETARHLRMTAYNRHVERVNKGMQPKHSARIGEQESEKIKDIIFYMEQDMLGASQQMYGGKKPKLSPREAAKAFAEKGFIYGKEGKTQELLASIKRAKPVHDIDAEIRALRAANRGQIIKPSPGYYQEAYNPKTGRRVIIPEGMRVALNRDFEISEPISLRDTGILPGPVKLPIAKTPEEVAEFREQMARELEQLDFEQRQERAIAETNAELAEIQRPAREAQAKIAEELSKIPAEEAIAEAEPTLAAEEPAEAARLPKEAEITPPAKAAEAEKVAKPLPPKEVTAKKVQEPTVEAKPEEEVLYHYTDVEIKEGALKPGQPHEQNYFGEGVYLTEKGQFPGKYEHEVQVPETLKILDLTSEKAYEDFRDQIAKEIGMPIERSGESLYDDFRRTAANSTNESETNNSIRKAVAKFTKNYDAIKAPYFGVTAEQDSFELIVKEAIKAQPTPAKPEGVKPKSKGLKEKLGRPLKELGGMPEKPPGLTKAEVERVGRREAAALRAGQKRGYPIGYKMAQREAKDKMNSFKFQLRQKAVDFKKIRDEMFNVVKNVLPTYERGKIKVMSLLKSISPEKTDKANRKNLMRAIIMTSKYAEEANQRFIRAQIKKELAPKKIKAKKKEGLLRGKWTPEIQRRLNDVAQHINDDREQARLQIADNIAKYEKGTLSYEDMRSANEQLSMQGIKGMTSAELQNVLDSIKSLKEAGKTIREAQKEKEDARINGIRSRIIEIVTGGKGIKIGAMSVPRRQLEVRKTAVETIANWQYGWDNYMDKLSKYDTGSKMYQSDLSKFGAAVHEAHNTEISGVDEQIANLFAEFQKIFNVKTPRKVNEILNSLKQEIDLGTFQNADGVEIQLKLTKEQLMKKYQELQDPTLEATFRGGTTEEGKVWGMRWTDEIINAVNDSLSPQEKTWTDYQMQWYQDYYPSINEVYRDIYHVDLPHNLYYSPIGRDIEADIPENVLLAKEGAHYASTVNGSLKSRTANALPLRFMGADSILMNHIIRMEHFKSWAKTMRDMRRVFGGKKVRAAIRQYHGKDILRQIDEQLNQMARGGIEKAKINRGVDYLRRNFTLAILGVKPVIGLKQIPSVIAYATEMPFGDFVTGVADFWTNPIKHTQFLRESSPYFKQRWKAGFERDIRFAMKKGYVKRLANKGNVRDWFMSLIRAGDKFATMQGGWAKYHSEGGTLKEIKKEAIAAAEQSTKRTQPSFSLESLSPLQRGGSWMKLFTMFQNQPNKYFRIMADNARNMRFGRQTKAKGTANMLLAWVVLPMLFQFIADALQFKKKHQLRAAILGPINHLLIIGQIAQSVWGWVTKETFDYEASPVFSTGRDLQYAVTKTAKAVRDGINPYKEVDMDDLIRAIEYYGQAAGKLTGVPTPFAVQAERAAREIVEPTEEAEKRRKKRLPGWRRHPAAELVFSPWALEAEDRVKAMTIPELEEAIRANTYKKRYKRNGKWYPAGHPHKGKEEYIDRLRAELKSHK